MSTVRSISSKLAQEKTSASGVERQVQTRKGTRVLNLRVAHTMSLRGFFGIIGTQHAND
jgi:hypothetical protein